MCTAAPVAPCSSSRRGEAEGLGARVLLRVGPITGGSPGPEGAAEDESSLLGGPGPGTAAAAAAGTPGKAPAGGAQKPRKAPTELELGQLNNFLLELHRDCDFMIKNFDASQVARDGEIEALRTALSIHSGAKFGMFLEQGY